MLQIKLPVAFLIVLCTLRHITKIIYQYTCNPFAVNVNTWSLLDNKNLPFSLSIPLPYPLPSLHPPPPQFFFLYENRILSKIENYNCHFFLVYLIISPNVQQNREALMGLYSGQRCVQGEFPHWDPHSIAAQVSQSQNPLSICHHDRLTKHILWFIWLTLYKELSWIIPCMWGLINAHISFFHSFAILHHEEKTKTRKLQEWGSIM